MFTPWLHRTNKGRVVYSRKPNSFTGNDVLRVHRGWLKPMEQATILEVTEVNFSLFLQSMFSIRDRTFGRVGEFIRDLIRRLIKQLLNIASFPDANDCVWLANELKDFIPELIDKGVAYGATNTDAIAAVNEFLQSGGAG